MAGSGPPYPSGPSTNVHVPPSPPQERPPQRIRRVGQSQIPQLGLTGDSHSAPDPPFPPRLPACTDIYPIAGPDVGQVDLPGVTGRRVGSFVDMPATDSNHIGLRQDPMLTEDVMMDWDPDRLMVSCGPIREGAFDDLGALIAPSLPGSADGTGLNAVVCGDTTYEPRATNEFAPQVMTQQFANPSWNSAISTTAPSSLDYAQRRSNVEAGPYHFDQIAPPDSGSFARNGFTMDLPPMAGPSTIKHTSSSSYPQSLHSGCHPSAASSTYRDPPITSSIARSLSTSDISSRATVPGLVSDLSGSTPSTWDDSTYAQALNAFDPAQIASVNALLNDLRTPPGMTTSDAPGPTEDPLFGESFPSMPQSAVTTPKPFLCLQPSRTTSKPMPPLPTPACNVDVTTRATDSNPGGDPACSITLEADTKWIDRSESLTAVAKEMRLTCKVPEGVEHVRAFRVLHLLFKEMFELCYGDDCGHVTQRRAVSHPQILR